MAGGVLNQRDIVNLSLHFTYTKFEWSGGLIIYSGSHNVHGSPTSHQKWMITKYTYDIDNNLIITEKLEGSWDDRASLNWV
ncbi:MAG: hypothetical protein ACYTFW_00785 [Planctomycetota bacterium]|jgi:hypothetical protein